MTQRRFEIGTLTARLDDANAVDDLAERLAQAIRDAAVSDAVNQAIKAGDVPSMEIVVAIVWGKP